MAVSYPRKMQQVRESFNAPAGAQLRQQSTSASNVRAASASLLTNRMDSLSFRMGRLSCAGLE
ncbi:hypothetical protein [Deinococcus humi]|uniref:Uncharacterized protein n=1 Tax=Deinococcus humi TaxID=662880 RepID=A0A7W8NI82_9DEIO|nr:hypothetical protein [Deinococcus humi]MBB5365578.1 hypothetical protein [Deinococcus humi]GGO36505.1 hypothetical protein GCM10008949_40490 [Deinococcus humi]